MTHSYTVGPRDAALEIMASHTVHVTDYDGNEMNKPSGAVFSVLTPLIAAALSLILAFVIVATTK
jgi:hypothetical protein